MSYLRSGIDGGRQGSSLVRNRVADIRGDLATGGKLVLSTTEPTVVDGNELGRIDFQAPLDTAGTDAILVAASIYAEADATFSSSVNATELVFATGASETAVEKMRITSTGRVGIGTSTPTSVDGVVLNTYLEVKNPDATTCNIRIASSNAARGLCLGTNGTTSYFENDENNGGGFIFRTRVSDATTTKMAMTGVGKVGIWSYTC
jgi:hypothetical protein